MSSNHYSVLLQESVAALVDDPSGTYIDGTFGRGGHSLEILKRLDPKGRLVAFDKDPQAVAVGKALSAQDSRFEIKHDSFASMKSAMEGQKVNGVLLDLGVSSPQLDQAERGFSFLRDGPLDMRMDTERGTSAAEWVNSTEENEMVRVFKEYGEERFAKRIARAVCQRRSLQPFDRTLDFAKVVAEAHPKWEKDKNPATRVFQAIRIAVNNELGDLETALDAGLNLLKPGGRFVVISFHSLEDRMVKRFFKLKSEGEKFPRDIPVTEDMLNKSLKILGKPQKAGASELQENIRSRSAVLRVAEKLQGLDE